jgi:hypothetical protein
MSRLRRTRAAWRHRGGWREDWTVPGHPRQYRNPWWLVLLKGAPDFEDRGWTWTMSDDDR